MLGIPRPSLVAALIACGGGAGLGLPACAVGDGAELRPEIDPTMPSVEAPNDPRPAQPTGSAPPEDAADSPDDGESERAAAPSDAGATAPRPLPGDVLITEVMYDPSTPEPSTEWLELYNTRSTPLSLGDLTLVNGVGRSHAIAKGVVIAAGAYVVLARSRAGAAAAKIPAESVLYEYGSGLGDTAGVLLANGASGGIALRDGATVISEVLYGGWFSQAEGRSVQRKAVSASAPPSAASFCLSDTPWAAGSDKGTPGAAGDCP
jgi:hypothetical protein